jgi:hypothetical protein
MERRIKAEKEAGEEATRQAEAAEASAVIEAAEKEEVAKGKAILAAAKVAARLSLLGKKAKLRKKSSGNIQAT